MNRKSNRLIRPVRNPERGQSLILMAGLLIGLLSMAALVIDLGNVYFSYRQLQAATDAAALAGAEDMPTDSIPGITAIAANYGSAATNSKNYNSVQGVMTNVSMPTPAFKCVTLSTPVPCIGPSGMNTIQVTETATVNTTFAKLFGVSKVNISAVATASAKSGNFGPFNVMMIIDNTPSMSQADSGCTLTPPTKIGCALAGLQTLAKTLSPCSPTLVSCGSGFTPVDEIGLEVFPPLANNAANLATDTDCNSSTAPQFLSYAASGSVYQVIPLSTDYRNSDTQPLNTQSVLSKAIGAGQFGCAPLSVESGIIDTFYADAISQATTTLQAFQTGNRANSTNVIILLSDGDANAPASQMPTLEKANQCQEAINAATTAKNDGIWVYAIAYGASTTGGRNASCSTDAPPTGTKTTSACATMKAIASDPTKFFSDTTTQGADPGCTSPSRQATTDLNSIFSAIAGDFTSARLIPNSKFQ